MATLIDPVTGKLYDGPDENVQAAVARGLRPATREEIAKHESDKAYEAKPFVEQAKETVLAGVEAFARPVVAIDQTLSRWLGGDGGDGKFLGVEPLSADARERAQRHPIASAVGGALSEAPLAGGAGVAGAIARIGATGLVNASEAAWDAGGEYRPTLKDAAAYGGIQAVFEGAAPLARVAGALVRKGEHAIDRSLRRAAARSETARVERDAAVRRERLAGEAPLHWDRLARDGSGRLGELGELFAGARERLLRPTQAKGSPEAVARAWAAAIQGLDDIAARGVSETGNAAFVAPLRAAGAILRHELPDAPKAFERLMQVRDVIRDSKLGTTTPELGEAIGVIDKVLRDGTAFGRAARQLEALGDLGRLDEAEDAFERVRARLFDRSGRPDPSKLRGLLKDPVGGGNLRADIETALSGLEVASPWLRKLGDGPFSQQLQQRAQGLRGLLREADEVFEARRDVAINGKRSSGLGDRLAGFAQRYVENRAASAIGAGVGGMIGGLPGAAAGWVASEAAGPWVRRALADLSAQRARDIAFAARGLVMRPVHSTLDAIGRHSGRAGLAVSAAWRAFTEDAEAPEDAWRRSLELVEQPPQKLQDSLATTWAGLDAEDPEAFEQIALHAYRVQAYLRSKMPRTYGHSLTNPRGMPPARHELRKWARIYATAMNPETARHDIAMGRASPEQIQTLKDLYPEDYDEIRAEALALIQSGARPSVQQRVKLALHFGMTNVDPVFAPSVSVLADAARQAQAEKVSQGGQGPSGGVMSTSAAQARTPGRRLEQVFNG